MPAISYNLITINAPEQLEKSLTSIYEALYKPGDETIVVDTGSRPDQLEKVRDVVAEYDNARLVEASGLTADLREKAKDWIPNHVELVPERTMIDFSKARDIAFDASQNPVIYWQDTDDVLVDRSNQLREFVDAAFAEEQPQPVGAVFLRYLYAFSKDGQCTAELKRERFVRKDKFYWIGRCHETLCPRPDTPMLASTYYDEAQVVHTRMNEDQKALRGADARNYLILRTEIEETEPQVDPRTLYYFANSCRGLSMFHDAVKWYRKFIPLSGSRSDQWSAWYFQGNMYLSPQMKRPLDALKCFFECLQVNPTDPLGYFGVARAYADLNRWQEALLWIRYGENNSPKEGMHCVDPTQLYYHPKLCAAQCLIKLKKYDQAREQLELGLRWKQTQVSQIPEDEPALALLQELQNLKAGEELSRGLSAVARNLEVGGLPNVMRVSRKICSELHAIPPDLEEVGIAKPEPPDSRDPDRPSLAIWTGQTAEPWDYESGKTGIGGSEKMVILLAPRLQRRGWNVTVYANMTHKNRGVDHATGVVWRHWAEYDQARARDVLVVWRAPQALTALQGPVKKRVFWGHDVLRPELFTPEVQAVTDLYQVQSRFHAEPLLGHVDESKIWYARNGIVPYDRYPPEKDPKVVVYSSSPDRGLLTAAQIVQRARLSDPDIRLVCCYGLTPLYRKVKAENQHGHIPDVGRDVNADMYETWLHEALDEVGAVVLNRVGFNEVAAMFAKGGVWLYPTRFPEISCMSAMEAMAGGCVPVCTNTGALAETLTRGGGDAFKELRLKDGDVKAGAEKLLAAIKIPADDPRRVSMAAQANAVFDVEALADEWADRLEVKA